MDGPYFDGLRTNDFMPRFTWVDTLEECADLINQPHEDYPERVHTTEFLLNYLLPTHPSALLTDNGLWTTHKTIMPEREDSGQWRRYDVRVGSHRAPDFSMVEKFMHELLTQRYLGMSLLDNVKSLKSWYLDFETIHPFSDGNGRVGGIVVAVIAHNYHSDSGQWLAPLQ